MFEGFLRRNLGQEGHDCNEEVGANGSKVCGDNAEPNRIASCMLEPAGTNATASHTQAVNAGLQAATDSTATSSHVASECDHTIGQLFGVDLHELQFDASRIGMLNNARADADEASRCLDLGPRWIVDQLLSGWHFHMDLDVHRFPLLPCTLLMLADCNYGIPSAPAKLEIH